jgi:hypothetical protein
MTSKNFRAPVDDSVFKKYWDLFLPKVVERDNFHVSHLQQLEILCNLYLDYVRLNDFVKVNGYSFMTSGRYGETSRPHVETQLLTKVLAEIRHYSKLLDLILAKDTGPKEDDSDEWE